MTVAVAPARPGLQCSYRCGGETCRRDAWREYVDVAGERRGFCTIAGHAFGTVDQYPAQAGSVRSVER